MIDWLIDKTLGPTHIRVSSRQLVHQCRWSHYHRQFPRHYHAVSPDVPRAVVDLPPVSLSNNTTTGRYQSTNQSTTFARSPVTGDLWRRTSNLIKVEVDKKPMKLTNMSIANSKQVGFRCLQNVVLVTAAQTPVGKEFYARGPAIQKALSLRRRLVRGRLKSPVN